MSNWYEDRDLEHPDISSAISSGYPIHKKPIAICTRCEAPVEPYDLDYSKLAVNGGDCLCKDCLEEEIQQLSIWEIAEALGFKIIDYRN